MKNMWKRRGIVGNKVVEVYKEDNDFFYTDKWVPRQENILVQALCYNEERLLPFFLDYYSDFSNIITIIDTGSTDSSIDIIQSFDKCEIDLIQLDFPEHREDLLMLFRNHYWKRVQKKYDWVFIVDIDEYIYSPRGLTDVLHEAKAINSTIFPIKGYDMVADSLPESATNIIDHTRRGFPVSNLDKLAVFNPNAVDIRYNDGCHTAEPYGAIKYHPSPLFLLQYRFMGHDYFIDVTKDKAKRNKEHSNNNNLGYHYNYQQDYDLDQYNEQITSVRDLAEVFDRSENSIYSRLV